MSNKERRLPDWINDIQEAIQNIRADPGSLSEESFIGDGKSQRAVIKGLIDIGEAAKNIMSINPGLEQSNPGTWQHLRRIYAMRIRLTHPYFRTNASVVFDTVNNHLPKLEALLDSIILGSDGGDGSGRGMFGGHSPKK